MPPDALMHRVPRNTLIATAAIALVALALDPQRPDIALGVLGGALLVAISYAAVAYTVRVFVPDSAKEKDKRAAASKMTSKKAVAVLVFAGHYALLGFAAYVMIARLRLHPIGLLGGVTSIVLAVAVEAVRPRARN